MAQHKSKPCADYYCWILHRIPFILHLGHIHSELRTYTSSMVSWTIAITIIVKQDPLSCSIMSHIFLPCHQLFIYLFICIRRFHQETIHSLKRVKVSKLLKKKIQISHTKDKIRQCHLHLCTHFIYGSFSNLRTISEVSQQWIKVLHTSILNTLKCTR